MFARRLVRGSSTKRQGQGATRTQRGQGAEWADPLKAHTSKPYAKSFQTSGHDCPAGMRVLDPNDAQADRLTEGI